MSLKAQALSGMLWSFIQQFSSQIISFIVSIVLARILLPSDFGLIAIIAVFVSLGTALVNSGMTQSLIRTIDPEEEDYTAVFYFNLLMSIIVFIAVYFAAPWIAIFYEQDSLTVMIRVYSIVFILNAFGAVQNARLMKLLLFKIQMKIGIPSVALGGVVGIVMALNGFGVWSLIFGPITQAFVYNAQLWFYSQWRPGNSFNKLKIKKHLNFGYKLLLSNILNVIYDNAYYLIIGKYFLPAQVGYFQRANSLKQFPVNNISIVLNKVTYPLFSSIQNNDERLKSVYKRIMQVVVFLVAPTLLIMAALATPLFRFLFTEKWLPAVPYFQILCLNGILFPIHAYNLNILNVKGRSDLFLKLEVVKKILLTLVLFIGFQFGIYGLLYGSVVFSIAAFFINTHYTGKFINYTSWQQTKDLLPIILVAVLAGGITYIIDNMWLIDSYDILRLILGTFIGVNLHFLISFLLKLQASEELYKIILRK